MEEQRKNHRRNIVAVSMVKNEMDIIESFVRHTLGFTDLMIIADHQSTDRTRDILGQLQAEGLPIVIETIYTARYAQAEVTTRLMHEAADVYDADLILPLDADEFIVPRGGTSVRAQLDALPIDITRALHWRQYLPAADAGMTPGTFALAEPLLRADRPLELQKVLVSGTYVREHHPVISQGNHYLSACSEQGRHPEIGAFCDDMEIAHISWRSPAQTCSKYAVGWMNIAAQYSINTSSGGTYRNRVRDILHGTLPEKWPHGMKHAPYDLHGRIPMPELRYSAGTAPDLLANVLRAAEALAEELAETRALAAQPVVTTVVPYFFEAQPSFGEAAFRAAFFSAVDENYPWHEILVPVYGEGMTQPLASEVLAAGAKIVAPDQLLASAHGAYAEWLLPGETVRPEKLRRMVTCALLQGVAYPILISDAGSCYADELPYIDIISTDAFNLYNRACSIIWNSILRAGKYPSRGLAGVLVRREVFDACHGLVHLCRDGRPLILSMWRELLRAGSKLLFGELGCLQDDYTGAPQELSIEDLAHHQMEWAQVCREEQAMLDAAAQEMILARQRRMGVYLLEHALAEHLDLTQGVWPAYQAMLASL